MKPKEQWGPADELASGVMLGLAIGGVLALLYIAFYLWSAWS